VLNKTLEYERERSGEVLKSTLRRRRKAPPAYVLAKMSWEEKVRDRVSREKIRGQDGVGFADVLMKARVKHE